MSKNSRVLKALLAVWVVGATAGCQPECKLGFIGDKSASPLVQLIALGNDQQVIELSDHSALPIYLPPQGGRVVMVGVKAKNLTACGAQLTASLRDPSSGQRRLDSRTINLVSREGGFGGSVDNDISTFANVPVCPNQWAKGDVFDTEYSLTVNLVDQTQRSVTTVISVTPTCVGGSPETEAECRCLCKGGYVLGESCGGVTDGGVPDGGSH